MARGTLTVGWAEIILLGLCCLLLPAAAEVASPFQPGRYPGDFFDGGTPVLYIVEEVDQEKVRGRIQLLGRDGKGPGKDVATFTLTPMGGEAWQMSWQGLERRPDATVRLSWVQTSEGPCLAGSQQRVARGEVVYDICMIWLEHDGPEHPVTFHRPPPSEALVHPNYDLDLWTAEKGVAGNAARCVAQTPDGYIWVGTVSGLSRFDGAAWQTFDLESTPRLPGEVVRGLLVDRAGRLVVVVKGTGLYYYRPDRFVPVPGSEPLQGERVSDIRLAADGAFWLTLHYGNQAIRLEPGGEVRSWSFDVGMVFPNLESDMPVRVESVIPRGDHHLILSTQHGIRWFDWADEEMIYSPVGWSRANHLLAADHGGLWITDSQTVRLLDPSLRVAESIRTAREDETISAFTQGAQGRLWLAKGRQLYGLAQGDLYVYPRVQAEVGSDIVALMEDRDHNLWIVTGNSGVGRLRRHPVVNLSWEQRRPDQTEHRGYPMVVATDGLGRLHFSKPRRFEVWEGTNRTSITYSNDLIRHECLAISRDDPEDIWYGLATFSSERRKREDGPGIGTVPVLLNVRHGQWADYVWEKEPAGVREGYALAWSRSQGVWYGTGHGLLHLEQGKVDLWTPEPGVPAVPVPCVFVDRDDRVWAGTAGQGLYRIEPGRSVRFHSGNSGLLSDTVYAVAQDADGSHWIGTARGLHHLRNDQLRAVPVRPPLQGLPVHMILQDQDFNLWLGTPNGLFCLLADDLRPDLAEKEAPLRAIRFGRADGFHNESVFLYAFPTGCRLPTGELVFSMAQKLAMFDPRELLASVGPGPSIFIRDCTLADGSSYQEQADLAEASNPRLDLPARAQGFLSVHFQSIHPGSLQDVRHEYRLRGLSEEWTDIGAQREQRFAQLKPGDYQFEVRAFDHHERPGPQVASLGFHIQPYGHQTWWFRGGLILLVATTLVSLHRYRLVNRMRREEKAQQEALDEERSRIARDMHDEIGSSLAQIRLLGELALERARHPGEAAHSRQIADRAYGSARSLREIIWSLNPSRNSFQDIHDYTRKLVQDYFEGSGIQTSFAVADSDATLQISPELKRDWILILKGIMSNVLKHSQARQFRIELASQPSALVLDAEDDGKGFEHDKLPPGTHGIQSLRERVARWRGQLELQSQPGKGTRIRVRLLVRHPGRKRS